MLVRVHVIETFNQFMTFDIGSSMQLASHKHVNPAVSGHINAGQLIAGQLNADS